MGGTLYLTDLDGTLLGSDARLSARTADILNGLLDAGLMLTCVTGRPFTTAAHALGRLGLRLPLAAYNGAAIVHPASGRAVDACPMDPVRLRPLVGGLKACGVSPIAFARRQGGDVVAYLPHSANERVREYAAWYPEPAHLTPEDDYGGLLQGAVYLLTFRGSARQLEPVRQLVARDPYLTHYYQQYDPAGENCWLEVNRFDADKAGAVRRLRALTGAGEVVCFGDNVNDLPMFAAADRSYATANAYPEVRAAATGVIAGNDDDGVANWLAENAVLA